MAMEELRSELDKCRIASIVGFDLENNHIQCYAHTINICSSHIIASFSATPKSSLSRLKVPFNDDFPIHNDSDSDNEPDSWNEDKITDQDFEVELPVHYGCLGTPRFKTWAKGMKRDPLRCARRVIRLLHSSDNHRTKFQAFIKNGNICHMFNRKDADGNLIPTTVEQLELLRDVKMRWDSVYLMLLHLRELRPISCSW
jgi:hypothetical protein